MGGYALKRGFLVGTCRAVSGKQRKRLKADLGVLNFWVLVDDFLNFGDQAICSSVAENKIKTFELCLEFSAIGSW